jgi:8-oxo-dGTP pyrophosphatase MutT (NUDIX family)
MSTPRPAATVVVLREGPSGPEVLMVQRSSKSGFMPLAHVFPGGRVDPEDRDVPVVGGGLDRARIGLPEAAAYQVAAVRECYEEAGVLLAEGRPDDQARKDLQDRRRTFGQVSSSLGWRVLADELVYWSWWITPEAEPRRYDTRFFIARVPAHTEATHDDFETIDSRWWRLDEVMDGFQQGELVLSPPTFRTLWELQGETSVEAILEAGRTRPTPPIMPRARFDGAGVTVFLPGDPELPAEQGVDGPTRMSLSEGRWFVHR